MLSFVSLFYLSLYKMVVIYCGQGGIEITKELPMGMRLKRKEGSVGFVEKSL